MGTSISIPLCKCRARDGSPKRAHLSREAAEAEMPGAKALIAEYGHDATRSELRAYRCPEGWWHLGTKPVKP